MAGLRDAGVQSVRNSREAPMKPINIASVLTIAVALAAAWPAAAQQKKAKGAQMTQQQQIEARHQCFLEAQAAVPGVSIGGGEQSQRTATYMACAQRKGVRP